MGIWSAKWWSNGEVVAIKVGVIEENVIEGVELTKENDED